jgi:hypothetical protein
MAGKLLQFPSSNPELFSREINCQVLRSSEFNHVLYAAIRVLCLTYRIRVCVKN